MGRRRAIQLLVLPWLAACDCGGDGVGQLDALIAPSVTTVDFGSVYVGGTGHRGVTLQSLGEAPLKIARIAADDARFTADPTSATLSASSKLEVDVAFRPLAVEASSSVLIVENDSKNAPRLELMLTGVGLAPLDCDDHLTCTEDQFDADLGQCLHSAREGACDDGSACTEDDACVDGECRGTAITCDGGSECTHGLCDPSNGCVYVADVALCDDANPCTRDSCTVEDGCSHDDLADGTLCGEGVQCVTGQICIFGSCHEVDVPDGFPCDDHHICSTGDVCFDHQCNGTRIVQDPLLLGSARAYGISSLDRSYPLSISAVLPDERLVFADPEGQRDASVLTLVGSLGGDLFVVSTATIAGRVHAIEAFPSGSILVVTASIAPNNVDALAQIFDIAPDGRFTRRGSMLLDDLPDTIALHPFAAYVVIGFELFTFDLTDFDQPRRAATAGVGLWVPEMAIDLARERLLIVADRSLIEMSIADPLRPVMVASYFGAEEPISIRVDSSVGIALGSSGVFSFDMETLTYIAPIDLPSSSLIVGAGDGFAVFTSTHGAAFYDVRDPLAPAMLIELPWGELTRGTVRGRSAILYPPYSRASAAVFDVDFTSARPVRRVTGPGLGASSQFLGSNVLISQDAVHALDLSDLAHPSFISSAPFENPGATLVDVAGTRAIASQVYDGDGLFFEDEVLRYIDATDLRAPVSLGALSPPLTGHARHDGSTLYVEEQRTVAIYDLTGAPAIPAQEIGSIDLSQLPLDSVVSINPAGSRVVVIAEAFSGLSFVYLIDVSVRSMPQILVQEITGLQRLSGAAMSGDSIVALESDVNRAVHRLELTPAGTLDLVRSTPVENARKILAFDGETAFLSTEKGLLVVDMTQTPPRYQFELPLPEMPREMSILDDHLLLLSDATLSVVFPPCPP